MPMNIASLARVRKPMGNLQTAEGKQRRQWATIGKAPQWMEEVSRDNGSLYLEKKRFFLRRDSTANPVQAPSKKM